jgi:hypothetical protein
MVRWCFVVGGGDNTRRVPRVQNESVAVLRGEGARERNAARIHYARRCGPRPLRRSSRQRTKIDLALVSVGLVRLGDA